MSDFGMAKFYQEQLMSGPLLKNRKLENMQIDTLIKIDNVEEKTEMKNIIFWDMTPCSQLNVNRRFGGTYHLHLQGQRNKLSKKQQAGGKQNYGSDMFLRNVS
jgi:hypothetical protein